jgi:hypothetical protein
MSLAKDQSILDVLARLALPSRDWTTVDNWDADLCAIGIASKQHPRRLVYISTYGRERGRYDYQCEEPTGREPEDYATVNRGENVEFSTLVEVIEKHLA